MKNPSLFCYALLFTALAIIFPLGCFSEETAVYSFGVVPQYEYRKTFRIWRPILDELQQRTGFTFRLVGDPKTPIFEDKYLQGVYDFAFMNPYHILMAHDTQGYLPLVKDGGRMLTGVLVVPKDSPIQNVQELDGKLVAFPSANALGASLLMRAELSRLHGVEVVPKYVQTHSSVYLHVALGKTAAGGGVVSTLNSQEPEIRQKLRILYKTRPVTPHPISAHPRVPVAHRKRVLQAILDMANTPKGAALLAQIPMRKPVAASIEDYSMMYSWGLDKFYVSGKLSGHKATQQHAK